MAEFDLKETGYPLAIKAKYYNALEIEGFSRMMKDPSDCYKFYWLEAIVLMFHIKRYPDLQIRPERISVWTAVQAE